MPFSSFNIGSSKRRTRYVEGIPFVGYSSNGVIPEHQAGDIIISIYRNGSEFKPIPVGWTEVANDSAMRTILDIPYSSYSQVIATKATSSSTTADFWFGSCFAVYRGFSNFGNGGTNTEIASGQIIYSSWQSFALNNNNYESWVVGIANGGNELSLPTSIPTKINRVVNNNIIVWDTNNTIKDFSEFNFGNPQGFLGTSGTIELIL